MNYGLVQLLTITGYKEHELFGSSVRSNHMFNVITNFVIVSHMKSQGTHMQYFNAIYPTEQFFTCTCLSYRSNEVGYRM